MRAAGVGSLANAIMFATRALFRLLAIYAGPGADSPKHTEGASLQKLSADSLTPPQAAFGSDAWRP